MPSRADDRRRRAEHLLRAAAAVAAAVLAVLAWAPREAGVAGVATPRADLDSALAQWTVHAPAGMHLRTDVLPTRAQRDWLVALRRAGTPVAWQPQDAAGAPGLVAEVMPSPARATRLVLVAPPTQTVRLVDELGAVDSVVVSGSGTASLRGQVTGVVRATLTGAAPTAAVRDSVALRPVLVAGVASWETKFVVAALEEDGWTVRVRMALSPDARVADIGDARLDTARYSAVIVLDSASAPDASALRAFVERGGGVVVAGGASRLPSYGALLPAGDPRRDPGALGAPSGREPRRYLAATSFGRLRDDALALEERASHVVVAVRRIGAGRVLQSGYEDTWRWRMSGAADDAPASHRAWWSGLVSSVVHAPVRDSPVPPLDEAPLAATVASLGPPWSGREPAGAASPRRPDALLFAILMLALLSEWYSRRLRGLR